MPAAAHDRDPQSMRNRALVAGNIWCPAVLTQSWYALIIQQKYKLLTEATAWLAHGPSLVLQTSNISVDCR